MFYYNVLLCYRNNYKRWNDNEDKDKNENENENEIYNNSAK